MTKSLSRRNSLLLGAAGSAAVVMPHPARADIATVHYAMQDVPEDYVYRAKDWGAPFDVHVINSVSPSAVQSMQALLSGSADIGNSGSGPVLSALGHAPNALVIVAATHSGGQRHELMVKPGAPYKSLADLKGKRIAIAVGSGAYIVFELYLAKMGWKNSDFLVVNMKPGDMGSAIASSQVDAALTWEPTPSILVTKGIVQVIQSFGDISPDPALLVARRSFAAEHQDALVRTIASMIDMYNYIKTNPDGAGQLAAKVAGESGATVSAAAFSRSFRHMTFNMEVTSADIDALNQVADFMRHDGKISNVPDFKKLIDPTPLKLAQEMAKAH